MQTQTPFRDDELLEFEANGAKPLPSASQQGFVANKGAKIWYASYGSGAVVILLHGGLGNSRNWGYQLPALTLAGYRVLLIDSRGHGRSTRDQSPYSYELMASDVIAVMNTLGINRAAFIGWSDGACTAMALAERHPQRVAGVFFFACNMDPSGTREFEFTPVIGRCLARHQKDHSELSTTPQDFESFQQAVGEMQSTQPNATAQDLARIKLPVLVVQSEFDEFIKPEHAQMLAKQLPNARHLLLPGVSHFAPVQNPSQFNSAILGFLDDLAN